MLHTQPRQESWWRCRKPFDPGLCTVRAAVNVRIKHINALLCSTWVFGAWSLKPMDKPIELKNV